MSFNNQIIALAGMFQAGYLVRQIARTGMCDADALQVCLNSIMKIDSNNVQEIYGRPEDLHVGLDVLSTLYERETKARDLEISQYVLGIAHLERKLAKRKDLLEKISVGIDRASRQLESFEITHANVVANLAEIYTETISTLQPRIVVSGEEGYLGQTENANKVRALLLALMRSAVLWRQVGGRRWQLLLSRGKIIKAAKTVRKSMLH